MLFIQSHTLFTFHQIVDKRFTDDGFR